MKMKTLRSSILCFVVLLLTAPLLRAQDLSKYRHFTLGMSLTRVLERTDQKMADVKVIHRGSCEASGARGSAKRSGAPEKTNGRPRSDAAEEPEEFSPVVLA
jgi:hypothetical protein